MSRFSVSENLSQQTCELDQEDVAKLTLEALIPLQQNIPKWILIQVDGVDQLQREFQFDNFKQAQAFSNQVGDLAEVNTHHPAILTEWGKVTVRWWTHKIEGLHKNDVIMAAKTDALLP